MKREQKSKLSGTQSSSELIFDHLSGVAIARHQPSSISGQV